MAVTVKITRWTSKDIEREYEFRPDVSVDEDKQEIIEVHQHGELLTRMMEDRPWIRVMFGEFGDCKTFVEGTDGKYKAKEL